MVNSRHILRAIGASLRGDAPRLIASVPDLRAWLRDHGQAPAPATTTAGQ